MAQTNQYGLRQWDYEEGIHREDLNQAFAGIDQSLAEAMAGVGSTLTSSMEQLNESLEHAVSGLEESIGGLRGDLTALETAQSSKAEYLTGTFTGNGANGRVISLGRTPKAVLLENKGGERQAGDGLCRVGGLALSGLPFGYTDPPYVVIQTGGFAVSAVNSGFGANANGNTYYYLAMF